MEKNFQDFSMQEALRLAQTPAGQRLLAMLQQQYGEQLRQVINQAASGQYEEVQRKMADLLSNPEAQSLLNQMRGSQNG